MKAISFKVRDKVLFLLIAITVGFTSCRKTDEEPIVEGELKFKVVNAVEGSTPQDFYQNDVKITTKSIAYGEVSDRLTLQSGTSQLLTKNSGSQEVTSSGSVRLYKDVNYTVFFIKNLAGNFEVVGYPADNVLPPTGRAGLRFLNLGRHLKQNLRISLASGSVTQTGLAFGYHTNYGSFDPSQEIRFSVGDATTYGTIPSGTFEANKIYTIWFDSTDETTVKYHVVQEN